MASSITPALNDNTALAVERTRLAHERTLMAWVRTATSLISFGFTIYKFFQYLRESNQTPANESLLGPRGYALIMIILGIASLTFATFDHHRSLQTLRKQYGARIPRSLSALLAGFIALLGIAMLVIVAMRQ